MPEVPLTFEIPPGSEITDQLEVKHDGVLTRVRWRQLGLEICHTELEQYATSPDLKDVADKSPGFAARGLYGFSIGQYTEVFLLDDVGAPVPHMSLKLGRVEVTVSDPSPLVVYLFTDYHDNNVHPDWGSITSMRVWGCSPDKAENYLLAAHTYVMEELGYRVRFFSLAFWWPDERLEHSSKIHLVKPAPTLDIEPLRLYYRGLVEEDNTLAVLQFYGVLEYYSIMSRHSEVGSLRNNKDLPTKDFIVEMTKLLGGEERTDICRLIGKLADAVLLQEAVESELIKERSAGALGNAIYNFRNSLVHAKYDHRTSIFVRSVFEDLVELPAWRTLLDRLAKAINAFGGRDI
jgi:hypothetical protein